MKNQARLLAKRTKKPPRQGWFTYLLQTHFAAGFDVAGALAVFGAQQQLSSFATFSASWLTLSINKNLSQSAIC